MMEGMNEENWQMVRVEVLKLLTPLAPPSESFWGTPAFKRYNPLLSAKCLRACLKLRN
jgi:hypothetical protein